MSGCLPLFVCRLPVGAGVGRGTVIVCAALSPRTFSFGRVRCPTQFKRSVFGKSEKSNNCRACGKIYCTAHIACRMPLPHRGYSKAVKVCVYCDASMKGLPRPPPVPPTGPLPPQPPPDPLMQSITSHHLLTAMETLREDDDAGDGSSGNDGDTSRSPPQRRRSGGFDEDNDRVFGGGGRGAPPSSSAQAAALRRASAPPSAAARGAPPQPPQALQLPGAHEFNRVRGSSVLGDIASHINWGEADGDVSEEGEDVDRPTLDRNGTKSGPKTSGKAPKGSKGRKDDSKAARKARKASRGKK